MKLGTVSYKSKLCNLDSMNKDEVEEILKQNSEDKKEQFLIARNISKRDISNTANNVITNIPDTFKNFIDNSTAIVKLEAMLYRASAEKTSSDTINEKIKNQKNAIYASINKTTSKFNSTNPKFSGVQNSIQETLKKYENALQELSNFYDNKIEQLILRKVELEAHLVGKIVREEFLIEEEIKKKEAKENDKILLSLSNSIKNAMSRLTKKKSENQIDVTMISKLNDKKDVEEEEIAKLNNSMERTQNRKQENFDAISNLEKEILSIEKEIKRLNENKKSALINAMESENKQLTIANEKKSFVKKIKLFFKSKFNAIKVIYDTVLNPLNDSIDNFIETELEQIKDN